MDFRTPTARVAARREWIACTNVYEGAAQSAIVVTWAAALAMAWAMGRVCDLSEGKMVGTDAGAPHDTVVSSPKRFRARVDLWLHVGSATPSPA